MTDRGYAKIVTYYQAFELVLGMKITNEIRKFLKRMEAEGHTEKSISYSIWRTQDKLKRFKNDSRFFGILKNEIIKYSWPKGDPRWDDYWKKINEQEKAKKLEAELKAKREKEIEHKKKYPGFVYFIQGENGGAIKIGYTTDVKTRLKTLQTSYPDILIMLCVIPGSIKIESEYHEKFKDTQLNGEWFKPTQEIFDEIERLKLKHPYMADS